MVVFFTNITDQNINAFVAQYIIKPYIKPCVCV